MQGPQALWGRDVFAVLGFEDYQQGIGCLGFGFVVLIRVFTGLERFGACWASGFLLRSDEALGRVGVEVQILGFRSLVLRGLDSDFAWPQT